MTIYRLDYNYYDYPRIDISEDEFEEKLPHGRKDMAPGVPRGSIWRELAGTYYYDPDNPHRAPCPDLSQWDCDLVLSERAKEKLAGSLINYGELLPLSVEGERRYLFNLLNSTDAIDKFNSRKEIFEGVEMGVEKIAFLEHEVNHLLLFNTPYDGYSYLYCTDEFKSLIENSGLASGWSFYEKLRDLEPMG